MAKNSFFLQGVGSGYLLDSAGGLLPLCEMQDMTIEINTTMENVHGGDGAFPIFNFIKDKSAQFTFTNAAFSLDMLKVSQGATLKTGGSVFGADTVTVAAGAAALTATSGVDTTSLVVVDTASGTVFTKVASAPTSGQYTVTAAGAMTFATTDNGKVLDVSYVYTDANAQTAEILTTSVPGFVELRHKSQPVEQPDGTKIILHTRVFKARCDGKVTMDFKRGSAYAPKLTFQSLDPQRADKQFVSVVKQNVV